MNINEYKIAMDSINSKKFTVKELEATLLVQRRLKKNMKIVMSAIAIMLILIIPIVFLSKNNLMSITVHAANGETVQLTKKPVIYKLDSFASILEYSSDTDTGLLSIELYFNFEGEDIDEITISTSEKEIKRKDLNKVDAYFIKSQKIITQDYNSFIKEHEESDTFLGSSINSQTNEVTFTNLVGSSYTLKNNEKNNDQYGLTINVSKNKDETFSIKDILLNVKIKYLDSSVENRKIKIAANNDVFSGIQMTLL